MICESCGVQRLAMKTVKWKTGDRRFTLCDECWEPISGSLWIVAGNHTVNARCDGCGDYVSLNDMAELRGGAGKRDFGGVCWGCAGVRQ